MCLLFVIPEPRTAFKFHQVAGLLMIFFCVIHCHCVDLLSQKNLNQVERDPYPNFEYSERTSNPRCWDVQDTGLLKL